jgi:hypothetical protein
MVTVALERLRDIKTLPQLVSYLRDELDWPVDQDAVEDDFTFDYSAEELGFDAATAVHIKEIKQLRPLDARQPWGIFWVNFEKKRLPVVMLRRILGHLVLKKRAAARQASQRAWHLHDLLFISAYGEESARAITFAHFSQPPESPGDLPVLKVLGWDDGDTVLHLVDAHRTLAEKLRWPPKTTNLDAWRNQWASAFTLRHREVITTTTELVEELARLADGTRRRARTILARESERGPLRRVYTAFKAALIHDLTEDDFADVIAQTISYGLLIARFSRAAISAQNLVDMVPATNPFLRELLGTFLALAGRQSAFDFDELGIQDVVEVLNRSNADAVKADFGNRTRDEDPVIHFYEHFLAAYDKKKKIQRGVFYTPQPAVSYIVRGVHELLQKEFGIEDGLASTITWGDMVEKFGRRRGNESQTSPAADAGKKSEPPHVVSYSELKLPKIRVPKAGKAEGEEVDLSPDEFFVLILDIATGTGTFLVETIEVIFQHLQAKWAKHGLQGMPVLPAPERSPSPGGEGRDEGGRATLHHRTFTSYWNEYVPAALLPRLYGYELMMAPYTIAHMKLALKFSEINARLGQTDYLFKFEGRAHIYLTNTLEPPSGFQEQEFAEFFPALAHEAAAVNTVKRTKRFTVAMGNPPYAGVSANMSQAASALIEPYKFVDGQPLGERKHWLQDDYVKFIRLAQLVVESAGIGILGYITNHGYLDNPTFRGMRQSLMKSFSDIRVLDLHGSVKKRDETTLGKHDENVFDIEQGVAIALFSRPPKPHVPTKVQHATLLGPCAAKYEWLTSHALLSQNQICPSSPYYFFVKRDETHREEYEKLTPVTSVFQVYSTGVQTSRDHLVVAFDRKELKVRLERFLDPNRSDNDVRTELFPGKVVANYKAGDTRQWALSDARKALRDDTQWESLIQLCLYRPFDLRQMIYDQRMIDWPRPKVMRHMLAGNNVALLLPRQLAGESFHHAFSTRNLAEMCVISSKTTEQNNLFPLYLYDEEKGLGLSTSKEGKGQLGRTPNFSGSFLKALAGQLMLQFGPGDEVPKGVTPEDIFHYAYGVFHSPGYRSRYAEFLKIDFPRLPLTRNMELFRALARLGGELVALHLLEFPKLDKPITEFIGSRDPKVEKISWSKNTVWINKAQTTGFKCVPEAVWNFHIGGYQVCEKWLKDRKGRTLSKDDIAHYHKIVVALAETIRLMKEIDQVIEKHGGWPGAFAGNA